MTDLLYKRIYDDLLKQQNKAAAEDDRRYHKYEGYRSLGIRAPILDKLLKKFKTDVRELSCKEALSLAQMFYENRIEETVLAGNFVLQQKADCIGNSNLSLLDRNLGYFCSWSTVDDFCIDVLQPILLKYPESTLVLLKKWNRSASMWKRRASVVAFVRKIGVSGKFTNEALELCESLIWDKEDLVQKAVGWCLKDIMRGEKPKVYDYIRRLRQRGVCATIVLYAIRDLKGVERATILQTPL